MCEHREGAAMTAPSKYLGSKSPSCVTFSSAQDCVSVQDVINPDRLPPTEQCVEVIGEVWKSQIPDQLVNQLGEATSQ